MKPRRERVQVVLALMPGAEPWLYVEHAKGWFKVPGTAAALEVLHGAQERWNGERGHASASHVWVRVPLELAIELKHR